MDYETFENGEGNENNENIAHAENTEHTGNTENSENIYNDENNLNYENDQESRYNEETVYENTAYEEEPVAFFTPGEDMTGEYVAQESYAFEESFPEQDAYQEFYYQPIPVEEPTVKEKRASGKIIIRVLSIVLAFLIGAGAATWLSFLALPKLVEREMEEYKRSNPQMYFTAPNPSLTAEQAGAPEVDENGEKKLLTVVEIARKVGPAVVGINTKVQRQDVFGYSSLASGSGSGIILSADGYIVTNNHVIEGAHEISVTLSDGTAYPATLIGADARTDLAVIKIEGDSFPTATLGNSSELQVGELAVAIGNPLGNELAGSVTGGYISALNRSITVDDQEFNLIQTDAAINPGNSGGALVNNYGEVIGINSVKMSASGVEGIGFAIPIDEAKPIIDDLIANGYVKGRPVIGIMGRDVSEQTAMYYDIPVGVYVVETSPYSAAERAGIKPGDVVVAIDGVKVTTMDELNAEKEKHLVGDTVTITVVRGVETLDISLVLQEDKPLPPAN